MNGSTLTAYFLAQMYRMPHHVVNILEDDILRSRTRISLSSVPEYLLYNFISNGESCSYFLNDYYFIIVYSLVFCSTYCAQVPMLPPTSPNLLQ